MKRRPLGGWKQNIVVTVSLFGSYCGELMTRGLWPVLFDSPVNTMWLNFIYARQSRWEVRTSWPCDTGGSGGNSSTQMHKIKMLQIQTLKYKLSFAYVQLPVHPGVNLKTIHRRVWHPLMTTLEVYAQNKKSDTFQQWLMLETCPYTI